MNNKTTDKASNLLRPTFLESLHAEEKAERLCKNDPSHSTGPIIKNDPWSSSFPFFLDSVYEEERTIELMLRAHESGDQGRVSELNDYILTLRKQSGMFVDISEQD